ncbi:MAG: hypothetical protein JO247_06790, partial [Chloroflexi bacterium]|nr:hypothetical protein [Chloroflexota bacterium]
FGYRPADGGMWEFLHYSLPIALVGTTVWLFHWRLVTSESVLRGAPAGVVFAAPRRPGIALLALLGLFGAVPAFVSLLWVAFDWFIQYGATLSGQAWWRDRTSFSLAAAIIGGVTWLIPWLMMQRAAARSPLIEGTSRARRNALALVAIVGAVVTLCFAVAALWLVFQVLFGVEFTPGRQSALVKVLASLVVAAGVGGYHALALRASGGLRGAPAPRRRLVALITPGSEMVLAEVRQMEGIQIQQVLQLASAPPAESDLATLKNRLESLASDGSPSRALLILQADGGSLFPIRD